MAYEQRGGDMKEVAPLLDEASKSATSDALKAFRTYMKAATLMNGTKWSPDAELATALNFSLNVKAIGTGERLQSLRDLSLRRAGGDECAISSRTRSPQARCDQRGND
jgi:hypothetical protein